MSESQTATAVLENEPAGGASIVNDCTIHVATVNGSGSQSSNNVLMRSIFQMGVPVSGKNMFPSNIAGLPTWFTIRANKDGWIARKKEVDIMVCMNPQTAREDVELLPPGSLCIYDAPLNCKAVRNDVQFFDVPFSKLAMEIADDARMRKLLSNMLYVGVVADLLGIERDEIIKALSKQFKGKKKAIDPNVAAIDKGIEFAKNNLARQNKWRIERMNKTSGKIIIAPGPNGEMSCPRRTGPLGIVTLLQHVELGDLDLALCVHVAERLWCRPGYTRLVRSDIRARRSHEWHVFCVKGARPF